MSDHNVPLPSISRHPTAAERRAARKADLLTGRTLAALHAALDEDDGDGICMPWPPPGTWSGEPRDSIEEAAKRSAAALDKDGYIVSFEEFRGRIAKVFVSYRASPLLTAIAEAEPEAEPKAEAEPKPEPAAPSYHRMSLRLPREDYDHLRAAALDRGVSTSEAARTVIRAGLDQLGWS